MFDELWSEIADAPGEIFDVIEYKEEWEKEEKFDVESYINGNTDYWEQCNSKLQSQKQMFPQFVLKPKKKQGNLWTNLITIFVIGNVLKIKLNWTKMITSKAQMLQVMKNCDGADTLTREQKFEVFVRVCDNMLKEGRLSKANHTRWTNIWWT